MAFFCPIFPKQNRLKAKEYEDTNYYSFDGGGRSLYSSRSMTALNFPQPPTENDNENRNKKSVDRYSSKLMIVQGDFDPTVDDELKIRRGDFVKALYRDREWIYVVRQNENGVVDEGFVPLIFCREIDSNPGSSKSKSEKNQHFQLFKSAFNRRSARRSVDDSARKPEEQKSAEAIFSKSDTSSETENSSSEIIDIDPNSKSAIKPKALMNVDRFLKSLEDEKKNLEEKSISADYARIDKERKSIFGCISDFRKRPQGRLIAEFDFAPRHEDDIEISKGEIFVLLNNDDSDWYWIRKEDSKEGFVPSNYVRQLDEESESTKSTTQNYDTNQVAFNELIVVADFKPEALDDLQVVKGDWIYSYQTPALQDNSWLWAYCPRTKRYGFVPNSIVRTPVATVL